MTRAAQGGLVYFLFVFAAGFLLGLIRLSLVVPIIGVRWAELAEMPLMLVAIVVASRWSLRRFRILKVTAALSCGLIALALMVGAELLMAWLLMGTLPMEYVSTRDAVSGSVYGLMLAAFALMPALLVARSNRLT